MRECAGLFLLGAGVSVAAGLVYPVAVAVVFLAYVIGSLALAPQQAPDDPQFIPHDQAQP